MVATVTALSTVSFSQSTARPSCKVGSTAAGIGFWRWNHGARLKVYVIASDFSAAEIPYLVLPLQKWSAVSQETGSAVTLAYEGTTSQLMSCENCVTIMRANVLDRRSRHGSEVKAYGYSGSKLIKYAAILIDPAFKNPETLTNAVAHELGHSFGLTDCYECKDGSTVMNKLKAMNVSNGMVGPTACDVAQVRVAYAETRTRVSTKVAVVVDEGEEGVEDDTPIVEAP